MRSGRRMCRTLLWLPALLAFSSLTSLAGGSPLKVMSAPNLLRVGTAENIFVQCQSCSGDDIRVQIRVLSHPTKAKRLTFTTVTLTSANNFQGLGQIIIPAEDFSKIPNMKQYVHLVALFPDAELEKVVLVSFQSGYIFTQTDKTLYTPDSTVIYRLFAVTPNMEPVERNDTNEIEDSVIIEFMNPDGIIFQEKKAHIKSGMFSGSYKLSDIASTGLWKVVTRFQSNPQQSYSAEFEVKEYVLPSFEIKLTVEIPFFHVDHKELTVNIKATYLFGEEVDGTAYVVFGVIHQDQKKSFPSSIQKVQIKRGSGVVKLKKEHITMNFPNIQDLVGGSIFVVVSVLTESGSEMVEAELKNIQIVTSPYTIHFTKTPKYFKPGMPFDVVIEVTNPDGTPANKISLVVHPGKVEGITAANGMTRISINTEETDEQQLTITANVTGLSPASATMVAHPYASQSKSYIRIGVDAPEIKIGDTLKVNLNLNKPDDAQTYVTYLILSRGQLLKSGCYPKRTMIAMTLPITKDMLPSFRIIAYYFTSDNEVVSDSVWVDVEDSCMGSLALSSSRTSYQPGKTFNLKVTGDPGAKVGLVAVDKGVYILNNKHRLTQKKVWDAVEKYDTGCTPGGGRDSMSVFYDAGLLFHYNLASGTPNRQELKCPSPSRRKRARTIQDVRTSLMSHYEEKKKRECCSEGMKDTPLSYNCERRSQYIVDDPACVEAFLHCCSKLENERDQRNEDDLLLARSDDDGSDFSNDITSRTQFPESWLWIDIELPSCPQQTPNCDPTSFEKNYYLKDSITTWQFTGISLSRTHGICVSDPLEVVARKDFFIDLRMPYSAVRGEQLEIKAILHNHTPESGTVYVELIEAQHVCSSASTRRKYFQEVTIGNHSTRSVPFIIIPMKDGHFPIEVKAAVKNSYQLKDGVRKILRVVPEGVLTKSLKSITLDPVNEGVDGKQEEIMNAGILWKNLVPNTPSSTHIYVAGREQVGALVENAISGNSMGTLITAPSGCGEQNIASMTLPVIATTYLDKTNQWETVGFQKREEALQHIKTGYETELNYRQTNGSFSVFPDRKGSTWLTAYVTKVFAMANKLVPVKQEYICEAIKFLILNAQQPDGSFIELGEIIHGEMIGDVRGTDSGASLSAFCLIAMQESHSICKTAVNSLQSSIDKTVDYLVKRLPSLTNPYAVAMTSYALANENKLNQTILYNFVSGSNHWPVQNSHLFTLEATAYALLALVKAKRFQDAKPVVRWFNQKQIYGGGYGSTQATILVYQAIAEYWVSANEHEYNVDVDIVHPDRKDPAKFNLNRNTLQYTSRSSKHKGINKYVKVIATGTGEATVNMLSLYYALPQERESDCQKFNLSVQLIPVKMDKNERVYKLVIHVLFKEDRNATMTILDIGLLTGFEVNTDDLNSLSTGPARTISRYEQDKALSERGSLIIYLDKVSNVQTEEIAFKVTQKLKVGVLQPAAVSVYEYYDHNNNNQRACVKFYHPERIDGELLRLCTNTECTCAEENCSMQKTEKVDDSERTTKVCETNKDNKIDFVYKVRLENFTSQLSTDINTMRVVDVIKEGSHDGCQKKTGQDLSDKTCDVGLLGELRPFLSYKHCRVGLNLTVGSSYLIMGRAKDIHKDEEKQSYRYTLGERTWIEYWPTEAECQTPEHRRTCLGMEEMLEMYQIFGCESK